MNTGFPAPARRFLSAIAIALGAFMAQAALAADSSPTTEPVYNGKPVAEWVTALQPPQSASAQSKPAEAEEAIHALGPDAIPFILRYRQGSRSERLDLIRRACSVLGPEGEAKLVEALDDSDPQVRETALEVLPKAAFAAAEDDIVKRLSDPVRAVHTAAIMTLVRLAPTHEETIAALIDALHDLSPAPSSGDPQFSREDAALTLGKLGPKGKTAVPALTELLTDPNDDLREAAATALWKIARTPSVVPVLADRLADAPEYQTCLRVLKLLGEIGPPARAAVPVIRKKIEDPGVKFVPTTVDLVQAAVDALAKIDPVAAAEERRHLQELSPGKQ